MDIRNFDVGLLVALDALLTEKSVTRAGERLHLSQPATSIILGRLRQYFGNQLLVPSGRRMVLTPLAESLVQPVRSCLIQIQHTVASKTEFNPAVSGRKFCLAASDYVTAVLMPQAMEEVARQAPGIKFELVRLDESMDQRLEKGEIDFLIRPSIYAVATHPKESLFEDTHTCVVWRKNSLIGNKVSQNQFLKAGHIEVHFGHAPAIFEGWFAAHYGQLRNIEVVAQDFEVACRLVTGTNRIATVMSRMALLCADYLPIRLLRPPFAVPKVTHCLQWHRYQDQDPGHIWLRAILKRVAGDLRSGTSHNLICKKSGLTFTHCLPAFSKSKRMKYADACVHCYLIVRGWGWSGKALDQKISASGDMTINQLQFLSLFVCNLCSRNTLSAFVSRQKTEKRE